MIFVTSPLPGAALVAGQDYVSLDWMPHCHASGDLFGVPHFDVHVYIRTEAERLVVDLVQSADVGFRGCSFRRRRGRPTSRR